MKPFMILIVLLLAPLAFAYEDYTLRENLVLNLNIHSSVDVDFISSKGFLDYAKVSLNYVINDNDNQEVISLTTDPLANYKDKIVYEWKTPKRYPLNYSVKADIKTNAKFKEVTKKVDFPIKEINAELYPYTRPSQMIDVNDDIKKLAHSISEGDDDLYSVVFNLAVWANKNVKYDLSSAGADAVEKSSWVLKNRVGVCDEITNLFISMCRSLGIPARFVTGISYTNDPRFEKPWGLHGWAEVYFPDYGWIPIDPTYGEYGFIDSGHIKLKDSLDSNKSGTEYEWSGRFVDLSPKKLEMDVNVLNKGKLLTPPIDLGIEVFEENTGFGSYNYIEVTLKNRNDYYVTGSLILSVPEEIDVLDEENEEVLLRPYELKSVYWKIKIPDNLKTNYVYTYPVSVTSLQQNYSINSKFYAKEGEKVFDYKTVDEIITSKKNAKEERNITFYCLTGKDEINLNENLLINCTITNFQKTMLNDLNVCIEKDCQKISVEPNKLKQIEFIKKFNSSGFKFITVNAYNSEISKASYITMMALDSPKIELTELKYPSIVKFDESFKIRLIISKKSYSTPKDVKVTVYYNKNKESWKIKDFEGVLPFGVELLGEYLKFNDNNIKIVVDYKDDKGVSYFEEKEFIITLDDTTILQKVQVILNQISLWFERKINA